MDLPIAARSRLLRPWCLDPTIQPHPMDSVKGLPEVPDRYSRWYALAQTAISVCRLGEQHERGGRLGTHPSSILLGARSRGLWALYVSIVTEFGCRLGHRYEGRIHGFLLALAWESH